MYALPALCLLLAGAIAAVAPAESLAQAISRTPLRMIVAVPAGGTSDVVARLLARRLEVQLGQPVVVDNRVGATGRIAVAALKSAAPDGGTVLFAPAVIPVLGPLVFRNKTYHPEADLAPVAQVSKYSFALAVAGSHPARDLAAFIQWARGHPKQAYVGNPGAGSLPHLLGVRLAQAAGIEIDHVPYQGIASLLADLLRGEVAAGIGAVPDLLAAHRAGRIRILAASGAIRSAVLPAVPTFSESGYAAIVASGWHAVYAPKPTPAATIDRLGSAIVTTLSSPEVRDALIALGIEATGTTAQALAEIMAADVAYWRPIVEASGYSVE
jgi:tripartite-type tricarboxylate transporter receptor subunit TctC